MSINETISSLWKKKGVTLNLTNPDFLNNVVSSSICGAEPNSSSKTTNGVYENAKSLSLKRPFILNGVIDENETPPPSKVCKQIKDNGINKPNNSYNEDLHDSGDNSSFMHSVNIVR